MSTPPFKLAASATLAPRGFASPPASHRDDDEPPHADDEAPNGRTRLAQMNPHLHCSVLGTCLGTLELRRLMSRFIVVEGVSDLDVHHDAVKLARDAGPVPKALHKALDQRHGAAIRRFAKARGSAALAALWAQALADGDVPGAYWAVLTHRDVTAELRQRVFGDVHMLSHLVGAANRADIRRLVELEKNVAELRERLEHHQERSQALLDERDRAMATLAGELADAGAEARARATTSAGLAPSSRRQDLDDAATLVALQTERRERAEQASAVAAGESARLLEELALSRAQAQALAREVAAMEAQMQDGEAGDDATASKFERAIRGQRVLYVGGRPSTAPAIRDLVLHHGGELQRHDGGVEDRKGLLPAAVAWASVVVFPVDCVDHDSVTRLKRLCVRQHVAYLPLRSAGVASFIAGLASTDPTTTASPPNPVCLKHG